MRGATLVATAVPVLALAFASLATLPTKLIYNASKSAPTGFYWIDDRPAGRGDYVLVGVPDRIKEFVVERGYLPLDIPLIKRVLGANGDVVCRRNREILIDGVTVAVARIRDGSGREMPAWRGCHVLHERRVFLIQDHPESFDSRYFGPVDRRLIIGRATRLRLPWWKDEAS